ncbi:MAG: VWA domain-containing protein [Gammaproteobacteria bacterium]
MGFLSGSQFNLVVSLRYMPVAGEMPFWCELFEQTSRILHDATDGALSIGQVLISANSMGGKDADIWIHPNSDVWSNSTGARLWFPFESLDVPQDHMFHPTILAHELSHYLFDLRDEYNNGSVCQGDIATEASMMEGYAWTNNTRWTDAGGNEYPDWVTFFPDFTGGTAVLQLGHPSEFCHDGNHDATANNNQNNINGGQSCWTYMANDANHNAIPYGLTAPGAGGPTLAAPAFPAAVVCTELVPVQRFMLVLDRSGSMIGAKTDQLKIGANFWVDYVNLAEELGLVTYAGTENLDFGMSAVPAVGPAETAWRTDRHNLVDGIVAAGATAIGDALRAGLNEITNAGRASSQVMILFTDGNQNAGTETAEDVLPDLRAAGVRVYTIGLGNDQDAVLLANIATTTGATYFPIDGDLPLDEAATAITEALVQLAGETRENGGIVSFNPIDGAAPDVGVADAAPPFDWTFGEPKHRPKARPRRSFTFPVSITAGSTHCTLGALWKNPQHKFTVRVFDPGGTPVAPGPGVRQVAGKYPYSFYEVDNPKPGTWKVEVSGANVTTTHFRTIGFEVNDRISLDVSLVQSHVRLGSDIEVRARLRAPFAVPKAKITGWVLTPSTKWVKAKFQEHTGAKGDPNEPYTYTARIPTNRQKPGQYLIVVDAKCAKGKFVLKFDELYRQTPGLKPAQMARTVKVPAVHRRALVAATVDREGRTLKEPISGFNTKRPWVPRNQGSMLKRWRQASI